MVNNKSALDSNLGIKDFDARVIRVQNCCRKLAI